MATKKHFLPLFISLLIFAGCGPQNAQNADQDDAQPEQDSSYNEELARELGADEYGMRTYIMAILKTGPNQDHSPEEVAELQRGHMATINRLAEEGKLIVAGPFLSGGEMRGIYIFNVETVEEAEELTMTDPAVQAGRFALELHPWYGSAALMKIPEISRQITLETF